MSFILAYSITFACATANRYNNGPPNTASTGRPDATALPDATSPPDATAPPDAAAPPDATAQHHCGGTARPDAIATLNGSTPHSPKKYAR